MEQLNGFELAGRPMKVGNVTERTDGGSSSRFDADELDRAGIDLGATGRLQLMFKLAEGTGLQVNYLKFFLDIYLFETLHFVHVKNFVADTTCRGIGPHGQ